MIFNKKNFFFLIFFVFSFSMFSYANNSNCRDKIVKAVKVKTNDDSLRYVIHKIIAPAQGKIFSIKRVSDSIKNIYALSGVKDIIVYGNLKKEGCELTYNVVFFGKIKDIFIQGEPFFDEKTIKKAIYGLREGVYFTYSFREKLRKEIEEFYFSNGFLRPSISMDLIEERLILSIFAGERVKIKEVKVKGDFKNEFERKRIVRKIFKATKGIFNIATIKNEIEFLRKEFVKEGYLTVILRWDYEIEKNFARIFIDVERGRKILVKVKGYKVSSEEFTSIWNPYVSLEWAIEEGKNKIIFELYKNGYIFPKVNYKVLKRKDELLINYFVLKGKRYKLGKLIFVGNKVIESNTLKKVIFPFIKDFYRYAYFDGSIMDELVYEIEKTYWDRGFSNVDIKLSPVRSGKSIDLYFQIKEGFKTDIVNIKIRGAEFFSPAYIIKNILSIELPVGYNVERVNYWRNKIIEAYQEKGFKDVRVSYTIKGEGQLKILIFDIFEGERYFIDDIIWLGDKVIKEALFRECVFVREGAYLSVSAFRKTIDEISALEVFGNIEIKFIKKSRGKFLMLIETKKANTSYYSYGIGWRDRVGIRGFFEFQKINPLYRANTISFLIRAGKNDKRFIANFEAPWKWERRLKSFVTLWYENEKLISYSYKRKGFSFNAIYKKERNRFFTFSFKVLETKLTSLSISESDVDRENAPYSSSVFSFTLNNDERDDPVNPSSGTYFSFDLNLAFKFLGTESKYLLSGLKVQHVRKIKEGFKLIEQMRTGVGTGNVPIVDRFFAGGSFSFRGAKVDFLGPVDEETGKPIGGKFVFINNIELWIPTTLPIEGLFFSFFYDMGNVMKEVSEISKLKFQHAVGVGLRYVTPIGPLRFDIAYNFSENAYEKGPFYYIAIGNIF